MHRDTHFRAPQGHAEVGVSKGGDKSSTQQSAKLVPHVKCRKDLLKFLSESALLQDGVERFSEWLSDHGFAATSSAVIDVRLQSTWTHSSRRPKPTTSSY